MGQIFGGNGLGHVLAAAVVTLLVRLFSCPGPVLSPENENEDHGVEEEMDVDGGEAPDSGKFLPVTIRWSNITCSLSEKSSESVSSRCFILLLPLNRLPLSFVIGLKSCFVATMCLEGKFDFGSLFY